VITNDPVLIKSVISQIEGEAPGQFAYFNMPNVIYFYIDECMFPSLIAGDEISVHAAIVKSNRGSKAINAAKMLVKYLKSSGLKAIRTKVLKGSPTERQAKAFNVMCGMKKINETDGAVFYGMPLGGG